MTDEEVAAARLCEARGCTGPDRKARHVEGTMRVCRSCAERGHRTVLALPLRYVHLRMGLRPGSVVGDRVSGGAGFSSSSPLRDAALSVMNRTTLWATGIDIEARRELHMTPAHFAAMRESVALTRAVSDLHRQWDRLMPTFLAPRLVDGADTWHRKADALLGWTRLVHRLPAPCPYCDTLTLVRHDGDDRVRCTICHRTWLEAEYRHFVRMLVEENT